MEDPICRIRRFNRAITLEVGALDTSFLGRGRPLGAARTLALITAEGTAVADLRVRLRLDSGLLSRILRRLEGEGLITTSPDPTDRRQRIARLTPAGAAEVAEYDRLNDVLAADMAVRLPTDRDNLILAMDRIVLALNRDRIAIAVQDPEAPDSRACLKAYQALLADRVPDLPASHVPVPDPGAADFRPPLGAFLIARFDGLPVGCVSLKTVAARRGEIKRLWVDPAARGLGVGRRLMAEVEDVARGLDMSGLRLDTNENLPEAIALYRTSGWDECPPFTAYPATHWFTKAL